MTYHAICFAWHGHAVHFLDCADVRGGHGFSEVHPRKGILGSAWAGLDNFTYMFQLPDAKQIFVNTLVIAVGKIVLGLIVPIVFALFA